ncbi:hypothetical protein BRD22_06390 [Halobacteriales archaeon SW_8_68_21]|nr:MAG: hypothetical protein BRD22_06390 [Halobacteriales archaeon SW_8_68_21]
MSHETRGQVTVDRWGGPDPREYTRQVNDVTLPLTAREFADRYARVIGDRDRFLWKWIHNLFDKFTLTSVPDGDRSAVYDHKTLLTMFVTVLDDLAESDADRGTFDAGRWIPFGVDATEHTVFVSGDIDYDVLEYLADLWDAIDAGIRDTPRYAEFVDVLEYDLRQTFNAMEYSGLVNDNPAMANRTETERHDAYNMTMFPYAGIDLMYSPSFDRSELGALRSILCDLQQMARIGNWVTTWERELGEGDISSGVVVCALRRGVIDYEEVAEAGEPDVERLADRIRSHGIESEFTREWELRDRNVRKRTTEIGSVDIKQIVDGIETVMNHHLASEGHK